MRSVQLKLGRAHIQLQALGMLISGWVSRNPITADCELREGRLGFKLIQNKFTEPPPLEEWGLIAGEIIHNIRSSLDNLVYALARTHRDPPNKPQRLAFPIYQDKAEFKKNGRRNIDQLPSAAADLIEKIQPFNRDGSPALNIPDRDPLVLLNNLSNADKHRVPHLVLIAPTEISHNVSVQFYSEDDAMANTPPDVEAWAGPLDPNVVLLEYKTNRPIASVSGKYEGRAIVTIVSHCEPITETLQALHNYTALVVAQFEQFFE